MKTTRLLIAPLLCLASIHADTFYSNTNATANVPAYGDFGISFQVAEPISVAELSFFGQSLGGGDTPYVQLWNDDSNTLLAAVDWSAGAAGAGWNTMALASAIQLNTGTIYQIQASAYWAPTSDNNTDFGFDDTITATGFYHDAGWSNWTPLGGPSSTTTTGQYAQLANFNFTTVPEPSTYALIGGFLTMAVTLLKRRR
jgi:hypothetical protein